MSRGCRSIRLGRSLALLACLGMATACTPVATRLPAKHVELYLPATTDWTSTGMVVREGARLRFLCEGRWAVAPAAERQRWPDTGPEGHGGHPGETVHAAGDGKKELPGVPFGTLLGRVGGTIFPIGGRREVAIPATGTLFLVINDYPFFRHDNRGGLTIRIEEP